MRVSKRRGFKFLSTDTRLQLVNFSFFPPFPLVQIPSQSVQSEFYKKTFRATTKPRTCTFSGGGNCTLRMPWLWNIAGNVPTIFERLCVKATPDQERTKFVHRLTLSARKSMALVSSNKNTVRSWAPVIQCSKVLKRTNCQNLVSTGPV